MLTAIRGHIQLLRSELDDRLGDDERWRLNTVQTAATRGCELVKQLQRFSRNDQVEPVAVEMGRLAQDVSDLEAMAGDSVSERQVPGWQ